MNTEFPSKQELHNNGYVSVIDIEKLLCEKLGKEWTPSGMSIKSLIDELVCSKYEIIGYVTSTKSEYLWGDNDSSIIFRQADDYLIPLYKEIK